MAINEELTRVEVAAGRRPLDPDDTEIYVVITKVLDALSELAEALETRDS